MLIVEKLNLQQNQFFPYMQSATQTEDGKLCDTNINKLCIVSAFLNYSFFNVMYCALRFKKQDRIMMTTLLRKL